MGLTFKTLNFARKWIYDFLINHVEMPTILRHNTNLHSSVIVTEGFVWDIG
jgi:hypothetical protein